MNAKSDSPIRKRLLRPCLQALLTAIALISACFSARAQKCDPPPANIVSWWSGESNALDNLGVNNGVPVNSPSYAPGKVGAAFKFNGSSQCIFITNSPSLQFPTALTIEAWVYPTSATGANSIVVKYDGTGGVNQSSFSFSLYNSTLYLNLCPDGMPSHGVQINSAGSVPANTWTHVAGTYDGSTITLYINGNLDSTLSYSGGIFAGTDNMAIGANVGGLPFGSLAGPFPGMMDEVSIYNRALSSDEIQAIYSAGSAGKCPNVPPTIIMSPTNQTVYASLPASFTVSAVGSQPLTYQWYFNGTNISGATSPTLALNDVQSAQAGTYYVSVSNAASGPLLALSSNATLTVLPAPPCDSPPANIVSWWSGESNALDNFGLNNGTYIGTPSYAPGIVGAAFSFNGSSQFIRVSNSLSLEISNAITLEAWVYPTAYNSGSDSSILCKFGAYQVGQSSWSFYVNNDGRGGFLVSTNGVTGQGLVYTTSICPLNAWTHLAASYDGANLNIYFNGSLQGTTALPGTIFPGNYDLGIGANLGGVGNSQAAALFFGLIDEPAIFSRALSAAEIQAIYNASISGLCPIPLTITSQPTNVTVPSGGSATFSVATTGSQPMSYQWFFDGTNLAGANSSLLTLSNLNVNQSGVYYVSVSNAAGGPYFSSNATLTVLPIPSCDPVPSNIVSWWSANSNAYDNVGGNNGALVGSPGFSPGEVGLAFNFNGSSQFVRVPDAPNLHLSNAFTVESWVYPTAYNSQSSSILCKFQAPYGTGGQSSWSFYINSDGRGGMLVTTNAAASSTTIYSTNVCPLNTWTHLAATYDGSTLKMYFNGALQSSNAMSGSLFPGTYDLGIGANIGGVGNNQAAALFSGLIDEPAIYSRGLSASEILAIFNAGISGKCPVSLAPQVYSQPASQKVSPGATVTFNPAVTGSPVLNFQWKSNGSPLSGATNLALILSNVTTANAGTYSLLVSNSLSSALSSNAALEVVLVIVSGNGKPLTNSLYAFTNSVVISMTNFFTNGYVFYTLNGTTPTAGSTLYSAPFVLSNTSTIQTLGYSADFSQSAVSDPITVNILPGFVLTATTGGGGSISLNPPGSNYLNNTFVTVTAAPSNGWTFLQWLGDAAGTSLSDGITMNRDKSVVAVFGTTVSNAVGGNGSIIFNPPGGIYPYGAILQASAIPQSGDSFVLWGDSATGEVNPLSFVVTNANPTISALFTTLSGGEVALAVVPIGHGTVSINPQANSYSSGSTVTITATPSAGHAFVDWSGGASGTNNPLSIQLNASETIYANFTTNNSLLIYSVTPPGTADGMAVDLLGEFGTHYRLDGSTNLSNWTALYNLTNSVGTLHYIDTNASNLSSRFYRGVILP